MLARREPASPTRRSLHVLVVDDDVDTRDMYALFFAYAGLEVTTASSASQALPQIDANPPDVVIADIAMPGMDGVDMCRRIRLSPDRQEIALLVLTGLALTAPHVERAIAAGADSLLLKPCLPETLLDEMLQVLACPPWFRQEAREARIRSCTEGRSREFESLRVLLS
jgi:CheY-like chemotaxis protein